MKPRKPGSPKFVGPRSPKELEYQKISREMSNEGLAGRWFNKQSPKERKAKYKEGRDIPPSRSKLLRAESEMYKQGQRRGSREQPRGALTYKELVRVLGKLPVEFRKKLRDAYASGVRLGRDEARNTPF
jgi:hypothetical protein